MCCCSVSLALASPSKLNYLKPFLSCGLKPQIARDREVQDTAAHLLILVQRVFVWKKGLLSVYMQVSVSLSAGQHKAYSALKVLLSLSVIKRKSLIFCNKQAIYNTYWYKQTHYLSISDIHSKKCFCKQMVTCWLMMLLLDLSSYYMYNRTYFYHGKWTACSSWWLLFSW